MLFLKRLEESTESCSLEELCVTDPRDILKQFLYPKLALFTKLK